MSPEMQYLWIALRGHLARAREDERGVSAVELVIITGILILMASGVAYAIKAKVQSKADGISL